MPVPVVASILAVAAAAPLALVRAEDRPPARALLDEFLQREVRKIADDRLPASGGRDGWMAARDRLRRELREMLGLVPEPPRGDLRAAVTGTIVREDLGIVVEKVVFQSVPGLYVTGNFYRPIASPGPLPAILYLCGHGQVKLDGVSYGNKASYQHHPAWFARNGYACLIVDTLQLGEIEGKHHGTYRLGMWWWVARGYTPAGVEAWNSIRALDYLESRPEVDPRKIGVTGRSGGGIGTWWLAALDDRPAAFVPVAGITDLENHVLTGCIDGHCDCNFTVNLYRRDYPLLAALAAPRPLLLANSDKDEIFPLDGVQRVHRQLREVYALLGAQDRLGLCITAGPHADSQELQLAAFRWMNRWLLDEPDRPVAMVAEKHLDPRELRVLAEVPADQRNTSIEESFVAAAAAPEVPADRAAFDALRDRLLEELREKTFRNQPDPSGNLEIEMTSRVEKGGRVLRGYRFLSEEPFRLALWTIAPAGERPPVELTLRVVDDGAWSDWARAAVGLFGAVPGIEASPDERLAAELERRLESGNAAVAILAPRGVGPARWSDDPKLENQLRRRLLVVGRPVEETWVFDIRRAARALSAMDAFRSANLRLEARGDLAATCIHAALLEPGVAALDLWEPTPSHRQGVPLLNVLKVLDVPQALGLVFPRPVRLHGASKADFAWTERLARIFAAEGGAGSPLVFEGAPANTPADAPPAGAGPPKRPNLIVVITDDQGYGDVGIHGNPVIRTPQMDRIAAEGVRFERFYVCPVCAPTRAALLTGRYNYRTGILDTYIGRALMYPDETTLAEVLAAEGYRTGIFGKWHLGDNYPMRPMDQGFQRCLVHRGGGIGQPSDPPGGTSYFDPVLLEDGKPVTKPGYVSDIITDAALDFIEENASRPFFTYLAFNCPHVPLEVPESYLAMYRDRDLSPSRFPGGGHAVAKASAANLEATARVYGMVTNIDDNLGRLLRRLERLGIDDETLLIFLTDNGPQQPRYNAGMLERKGSVHEGGIRVPCFWRWPGTLPAGRSVDRIAAHIDVLPTVLEALGVAPPSGVPLDGRSLWPLLTGRATAEWPDRALVFQWHRGYEAEPFRACAVRTQRWKLVQPAGVGEGPFRSEPTFRLYDMEADPLEEHDIASREAERVSFLKRTYEAWYADVTADRGFVPPRIVIDGIHEDPMALTRQDWRGPKAGWAPRDLGHWEVQVAGSLEYDVVLRFAKLGSPGKAWIEIGGKSWSRDLPKGASECRFEAMRLPEGPGSLAPRIEDDAGAFGVDQVEITATRA